MDVSEMHARKLLKTAGFDVARFDDVISVQLSREIASIAPSWACRLAVRFGWRWPLRLNGVRVWQHNKDGICQSLEIAGRSTVFSFSGNVR